MSQGDQGVNFPETRSLARETLCAQAKHFITKSFGRNIDVPPNHRVFVDLVNFGISTFFVIEDLEWGNDVHSHCLRKKQMMRN